MVETCGVQRAGGDMGLFDLKAQAEGGAAAQERQWPQLMGLKTKKRFRLQSLTFFAVVVHILAAQRLFSRFVSVLHCFVGALKGFGVRVSGFG